MVTSHCIMLTHHPKRQLLQIFYPGLHVSHWQSEDIIAGGLIIA